VIDATTGVIDLAASTPNTYTITYSFGTAHVQELLLRK
jgi:hypothetical protein